jgi:Glu-tRNA(Gln) amidotransferase subunit E-like FAD-binding protein
MVAGCGADLRHACFLVGERLVGLRRKGVPVDRIDEERWCGYFQALARTPLLREAWEPIVRCLADSPETSVAAFIEAEGLGREPAGWRESLHDLLAAAAAAAYDADPGRLVRLAMGRAMDGLRGKVPAAEVARAIQAVLEAEE